MSDKKEPLHICFVSWVGRGAGGTVRMKLRKTDKAEVINRRLKRLVKNETALYIQIMPIREVGTAWK